MYKKRFIIGSLIILSIILFGMYHKKMNSIKVVESLSNNNNNIVLMGDSIFKNDTYVNRGDSVGDLLQNKHGNVLVVAEDNSTINDLEYQFSKIPNNMDNSNTKIIVSVGGNDLLHKYAMADVSKTRHVDTIFNKYTSNINNLRNSCKCGFVLCNIYYPRSENYVRYYDIIELWNNKLDNYAKSNDLQVIDIDDKVDKAHYFTHDIEPSLSGGHIISNNILSSIE